MSRTWAVGALLVNLLATAAIRGPHVRRAVRRAVVLSRETRGDRMLVAGVGAGYLAAILWATTDLLAFAARPASTAAYAIGVALIAIGLALLAQTHADLGENWSNTLEIRDGHRLVTSGPYRHVRHPMYLAFLVGAVGQALVVPNWIGGGGLLVAFIALVAGRLREEERLLSDRFGPAYVEYAARTRRLLPGVW